MNDQNQTNHVNECGRVAGSRRRYRKPLLERLGELRTLTLGGSPGVGDSGGTYWSRLPPGDIRPGFLPPDDHDPLLP